MAGRMIGNRLADTRRAAEASDGVSSACFEPPITNTS